MNDTSGEARQPACIVAGAGPRLGIAIAERFAAEGFAAYPLSCSPERLSPRIAKWQLLGLTIRPMLCDVTDPDAIDIALRRILRQHGFCDVLVYNAGNVAGALALVRKTLNGMRSAGGGTMLFTGCSAVTAASIDAPPLGIGQAGLRVLVDSLAREFKQWGIRTGIVTVSLSAGDDAPYVQRAAQAYWDMFIASERAYTHELRVER